MFKRTLLMVTLGLLALVMVACGGTNDGGETAAIVNEEVITVADVDQQVDNTIAMYAQDGIDVNEQGDEFVEMIKQQTLDGLITEVLLVKAAQDYTVSEEEVTEEYEAIKAGFETEEQFNEVLAANNFTEESLKENLEQQLKIDQFFLANINEVTATEEELQELFEQYSEMVEEELEFEEVKVALEQEVVQQKQDEEMGRIIQELKEQAEIEILI
ncbi:hypothetical protein BKP35_09425 [Anaerobacillus arseniciselenatis]|uniref:Peptidylprolyl isomerase n=1 Tax=Anaerobacillus arseniciselenatis TaxID=85682 RepID=A0A1S2LK41_9BACI|nr:SurA N-terminal domain-containing protein [Anaerobacillus arseniciselenatis]OIJ12791.1 hypothetical protein BKP35_09425 [Anaerobacillus arseniciselenatis]